MTWSKEEKTSHYAKSKFYGPLPLTQLAEGLPVRFFYSLELPETGERATQFPISISSRRGEVIDE